VAGDIALGKNMDLSKHMQFQVLQERLDFRMEVWNWRDCGEAFLCFNPETELGSQILLGYLVIADLTPTFPSII
jgi:hypothetical protein